MAPPTGPLNLDVEAISGICGIPFLFRSSISIAAWVVVFSPQIIENFRRGSADGLSLHFIIIWLAGDVFNILGAVLQDVLPTMIILAVYYTIADLVLLAQCFYYKGFTLKDEPTKQQTPPPPRKANHADEVEAANANERTALLDRHFEQRERRGSDWSHLNPAAPMLSAPPATPPPQPTRLQAAFWNSVAVLMVCAAGVVGWYLSRRYADGGDGSGAAPPEDAEGGLPAFSLWGQIFGWFCAVLYLGSRLPQLLLNWRRKSTDGVSMLFFLFACLGNLTYVLSIFAYDPHCGAGPGSRCQPGEAGRIYGRYILVNLSWLAGSLGTLFLDLGIFAQFFIYSQNEAAEEEDADAESGGGNDEQGSIDESRWDQQPLLERSDSFRT
ncbi:vacuolar membrane transporter [Diatrype stigma]|uniref:Vacuolar membrane transporter n=1 Tax=Diatrype stigma TaxID=117547 RepID=A0AAN9UDH5_9PEZI